VAETLYFFSFFLSFFSIYHFSSPWLAVATSAGRALRWRCASPPWLSGGPGFWLVLLWLGALFSALMAIMPW
jgi:hypothetical protein